MNKIPDFHNFWRFWSVRLAILSGAFSAVTAAYIALPPDWLPAIPQAAKTVLAFGALGTAFGAAIARGVVQSNLTEKPE